MNNKVDKIIQYVEGATFCACLLSLGHMSASYKARGLADYTRSDGKPLSVLQCVQLALKDTAGLIVFVVKP